MLQDTIIEPKGGKQILSNGSDGEVRTIASKGLELSMFEHIESMYSNERIICLH